MDKVKNEGGFTINMNSPGNFIAQTITIDGDVNIGTGNMRQKFSDEQIAHAIAAINGKDKPLCEKQLFLAVVKVLVSKCGWSGKLATVCERINSLPGAERLEVKCEYNNVKKIAVLRFAAMDYSQWEDYQPREGERDVFRKNKALAQTFEEELDRQMMEGDGL